VYIFVVTIVGMIFTSDPTMGMGSHGKPTITFSPAWDSLAQGKSVGSPCVVAEAPVDLLSIHPVIELDDGKIYRKALYLMVKTMVSCRFSLKPIQ
jgi:hypothetical protein